MENAPHSTFLHLGIAPKMLQILEHLKFTAPTPIQFKAIPMAIEGKDIVGIAQTGTGKTMAFGIPMIQRLASEGGRGLVLVPTRELALQVEQALRPFMHPFGFNGVVLIGGTGIFPQVKALKKNPRIIIATPGRLIDHIQQKNVSLKDVQVLVLDEADRMFDMGFQPQVERILREVPHKKQSMLFSATMPPNIVRLATQHMKLPINVEIAPQGTAATDVTQELFIVREDAKKMVIKMLLEKYRGSVLIFARTRIGARKIAKSLQDMGHRAGEIHSDRTMGQRKEAMEGFKNGRYRVLVATDIASRGIDVKGIELVINYDIPEDIENYVHRIGRTGRAGQEGHAVSLATPDQGFEVLRIERLIRKQLPRAEHPEFQTQSAFSHEMRSSKGGPGRSSSTRRSFKPRWGSSKRKFR